MWDFIVMGQIPGTSVQVTFTAWLYFVCGLAFLLSVHKVVRTALAEGNESLPEPTISSGHAASTTKHIALVAKLLLAIRMRHVIETAAYSRWLITRQQIQA